MGFHTDLQKLSVIRPPETFVFSISWFSSLSSKSGRTLDGQISEKRENTCSGFPFFELEPGARTAQRLRLAGEAGELGSLFVLTILAIVTSRGEKRAFEEFSKMAPLPFPNATFKVGFPGY